MKATELMQGDLVLYEYNGDRIHARVVEIYRSSALVESVSKEYEPIEIAEDKLFPVALTQEILEKNNFERLRVSWVLRCYEYYVTIQFIYGKWGLSTKKTHAGKDERNRNDHATFCHDWVETIYVHELQHALRLCEIEKEIAL